MFFLFVCELSGGAMCLACSPSLPSGHPLPCLPCAAGFAWVRRTTAVSKRHVVARLPRMLCLQLRRSFWAAHGPVKVHGHVSFPLQLQLDAGLAPRLGNRAAPASGQPPTRPSILSAIGAANTSSAAAAPLGSDSGSTQEAGSGDAAVGIGPAAPALYNLRAVVVHHGFASTGHYTVYRSLDAAGLRWARVSDDTVTPATAEDALAAEATLFLYEADPSPRTN